MKKKVLCLIIVWLCSTSVYEHKNNMCPVAFGAKGDFNVYQGLMVFILPSSLAINHGENRELWVSSWLLKMTQRNCKPLRIAIVWIKGDNNFLNGREIFSWEHFIMIDILFFKTASNIVRRGNISFFSDRIYHYFDNTIRASKSISEKIVQEKLN